MDHYMLEGLDQQHEKFLKTAKEICRDLGSDAALLMVGSRTVGFEDESSDYDFWMLGKKEALPHDLRKEYEDDGFLWVDSGDFKAHWFFDDLDCLVWELKEWPDEKMWILSNSRLVSGSTETLKSLREICDSYPHDVIARRLVWHFGRYRSLAFSLTEAERLVHKESSPATGIMMIGQAIQSLCKVCFLAEHKPFPYNKWLVKGAKTTELGAKIGPLLEEAAKSAAEFLEPHQHPGTDHESGCAKTLLSAKNIVKEGLKELGWDPAWVDNMVVRSMGEALRQRP